MSEHAPAHLKAPAARARDPWEVAAVVAVVLSCVLHVWLSLTVGPGVSWHDIGTLADIAEGGINEGHFGYIQYLLTYRQLPDFDPSTVWSYYNPPLYHIVCAVLIGLCMAVTGWAFVDCLHIATLVSCACVCATVVICWRMLRRIRAINGPVRLVIICLVAFHPTMSWLSFTGTNDAMAMMLAVLACERTLAWWELGPVPTDAEERRLWWRRCMAVIVQIALALGLGMAAKVSAVLVAPGIAIVFLARAGEALRARTWRSLVVPFVVFLAVSVPIGLAYPVHNLLAWDLPLTYVQYDDDMDAIGEDASLWSRLGIPSADDFESLVLYESDIDCEDNVWAQALKTSLFDEYYVSEEGAAAVAKRVLLVLGGLLALALAALGAYGCTSRDVPGALRAALAANVATILVFYANFCLTYLAECTMNFRYIVAAFPLLAVLAAVGASKLMGRHGWGRHVVAALGALVAAFSALGAGLYLLCLF